MATLYDQMLADGATLLYKFNEASGSIINSGSTAGSYDLTAVSSNVTRQVAGRSGPDALAILGSTSNAAAPSYGHAQGTRPSISGNKTFSLEVVCKCPLTKAGQIVGMDTGDGFTSVDLSIDSGTGAVRIGISVQTVPFNSQILTSADFSSAYHHVVLTWDGDRWRGYLDGTLVINVALGAGNNGIYNPSGTVLSVAGTVDTTNENLAASVDVLGIYTGHVLTGAEVTTHFGLIDVLGGSPFFFDRFIKPRGR